MRSKKLVGFLLMLGLILSACIVNQAPASTVEINRFVEVTRLVEATRLVEVTRIFLVEVAPTPPPAVPASTGVPPIASAGITPGPSLQSSRMLHTATPLLDGKILLVGGSRGDNNFPVETEIFDPETGQLSPAASLHTPRHDHTATLLKDGRVLVVGGYGPQQWLGDAEIYDPTTNTWTVIPTLSPHGVQHTATLLNDGRVLVVGGCIGSGVCTGRVELFNPQTNTWTEGKPLESNRASHTANLLRDGRVLIAGGGTGVDDNIPTDGDALIYNPQANTWTATGPMFKMRSQARSVLLIDGRVLVTGGINNTPENLAAPKMSASAEIYDPAANAWARAANLTKARYQHKLVLLTDGQVLSLGGTRDYNDHVTAASFIQEVELYNPQANQWRSVGSLSPRENTTAVLLPDGRVWVAGGRYLESYLSDSWLIDPAQFPQQ